MPKINLIYGSGDVLHTHININPFATDADGKRIVRDSVKNIDKYADTAELKELVATDVIDYFPAKEIEEVVSGWASKIRLGGTIVIGGIDLMEVCKSLSSYNIDVSHANALLHGEQEPQYLIRKSSFTTLGISSYLKDMGFKIIKKRIQDYKCIVEGTREI